MRSNCIHGRPFCSEFSDRSMKIRNRKVNPIPIREDFEKCESRHVFARSFKTVAREYMENCTIAGCRHLVDPNTHKCEKVVWFIVICLSICGVAYMSKEIWIGFIDKPTFVSLESNQYPIWRIPFPAVGFCSANKISKRKATEYAEYLSKKGGYTKEEWLENLVYLGRNVDYSIEDYEDYVHFMDVLQRFDANETTGMYDTYAKMKMLSPTCEEMLIMCRWLGAVVDCKNIFEMHRTMEGFCCTFNYIRSIDHLGSNKTKGETLTTTTYLMGLTVLLDTNIDDYFYTTRNTEGFNVLIFNPNDYPDVNSGGVRERYVTARTDNLIGLTATTVQTAPAVRKFSIRQRGCMFRDDMPEEYGDLYTFSNCIVSCKMKIMEALCKCVTYNLPATDNITVCGLYDIPCLNKYTTKFRSILAGDFFFEVDSLIEGFEEEREDGMHCEDCLPDCSTTKYKIRHTWAPLDSKNIMEFFGIDQTEDRILVSVYYSEFDTNLFKMDAVYYWFEILSNFGGIGGLFVGFSLISLVEFFYFFTLRFFVILRQNGYKIFGRF